MEIGPRFVLLLIAVVVFAVASIWAPPTPPRFSLVAAGLAVFAAAFLFSG